LLALFVALSVGLLSMPAPATAGVIAPAGKCRDVNGTEKVSKVRSSMLCFTNYARAKKGLKRYRPNAKLNFSSKRKAGDIIRCGAFSHEACGRDFAYWIDRSGYKGCSIGENIAWGSGGLGRSREIFRAWMNSPGHRAAILDSGYRHIGIGVRTGKFSGYRGARIWVQNFGRPC
jgi:uncharacterized protein YkwD